MKTNTLDFDAQALREKILDLAMRGKLVPQDPNDEPASVLLEKIKAEKDALVKEKKIKKSKSLPEITDDEKPFDIPDGWEWVRLGSIGEVFAGGDKPDDFSDIKDEQHQFPIYSNGVENKGLYGFTSSARVKQPAITLSARGTIGHVEYRAIPYVPIIRLISFVPYDESYLRCIFYFLQSKQLIEKGDGSSIPQLTVPKLKPKVIPLPPLSEQSRIAAKITHLFGLITKIEKASKQYKELQASLKSKVLDLAMCDKLVEQNPNDEAASVLLDKIKEEKTALVKEKKIKKSKPLPEITNDEKPFEIPDSWEWVRLGEIAEVIMGQSPKGDTVNTNGDGVEFHQGKTEFTNMIINKSNKYTTSLNKVVSNEYIVMAVRAPVGDVNLLDRKIVIGRGLAGIKAYICDKQYIFYYLNSIKPYYEQRSTGTTFKAINGKVIRDTPVPLPPLEEQNRIVTKLEKVLSTL